MPPTFTDWDDVYFVTDRLVLPPPDSAGKANRKLNTPLPSDFVDLMYRVGQGNLCETLILLPLDLIAAHVTYNRQSIKEAKPDLSLTPFRFKDLSRLIQVVDAMGGHGMFIHPDELGTYFWFHANDNTLQPCGPTIDDAIRFSLPTCQWAQDIPFVYFNSQGTLNTFELFRRSRDEPMESQLKQEFEFITSFRNPSRSFLQLHRYSIFYSEFGVHIHNSTDIKSIVILYDPTKKNNFIPDLIEECHRLNYRDGSYSEISWETLHHNESLRQLDLFEA